MTRSERARAQRLRRCAEKRRYATWDEARLGGLAVWRENPRPTDANMPTAYPCDVGGERHYHYGHLRFQNSSQRVVA